MKIVRQALKSYLRAPLFLLWFVCLYVTGVLLSFLILAIQPTTAASSISFMAAGMILTSLVDGLLLSMMIGGTSLALRDRFSIQKSAKFAGFFLGNSVLIFFLVIANLLAVIATAKIIVLLDISKSLCQMSVYIAFLLLLIFLSFQNFIYTLKGKSVWQSIAGSVKLSCRKWNYFKVLAVLLVYPASGFLISYIPSAIVQDFITYLVVLPIILLLLTALFENVSTR